MSDLGFIHQYMSKGDPSEKRTILLLHGTGGSENDLLELGISILPGANFLSPRGKISENGMARFFKRLAEGVFDEADLKLQAAALTQFVAEASEMYQFDPAYVYSVGYSNGANIAAAMMLLHPNTLAGGVFYRAMVPLQPEILPDLSGKSVFMLSGVSDPIVSNENAKRLENLLSESGASVRHDKLPTGHQLIRPDVELAQQWFRSL